MKELLRKFAVAYGAGAIGGLIYCCAAWAGGRWHLYAHVSAGFGRPEFSWPLVSLRILYGSLWGLLLVPLSPLLKAPGWLFGAVVSLIPSGYLLLVAFPQKHLGLLGASLGPWVFLVVLGLHAAAGIAAGWVYSVYYR